MDNYLENLNSDGQRLEKDAEFTIDPLKQAERYATFQHQNSVYCLLRIFQGLTLARVQKIDIKVEKRRITLEATGQSEDLRPHKLLETLYKNARPPLLEHICVGVFASTHPSVERLEIALGQEKLVVQEQVFRVVQTERHFANFHVTLVHSKRGWLESGAKDQLELAGRLHHAPMPVTIDSQNLAMNEPAPRKERWYQDLSRPQLLARVEKQLDNIWEFEPLGMELFLSKNSAGSKLFTLLDPDGTLFLDLAFTEDQKLVPIIDGVAGTPVETGRFPGLQGCQQAPRAQTDLSGLTLSREDLFLSDVQKRYRTTLETVLPHLSQLQAVWPKNFDLASAVGTASFAGELALVTVPVTLVFGGLYQTYDKLSFRVQQRKARETLVRETEARIRAILQSLT